MYPGYDDGFLSILFWYCFVFLFLFSFLCNGISSVNYSLTCSAYSSSPCASNRVREASGLHWYFPNPYSQEGAVLEWAGSRGFNIREVLVIVLYNRVGCSIFIHDISHG